MSKKLRPQLGRVARDTNEALVRRLTVRLKDPEAARDVMQDAYVRLMGVQEDRQIANPAAFLYRTAQNLALDRLRADKRRARRDEALAKAQQPCDSADPETVTAARQDLARMRDAINALPPKCRLAFIRHRFDGRSYPEIAAELGVSVSMVEKYIMRALKACRQAAS